MKVKTLIKRLEKAVVKNPEVANYNVVITPDSSASGVAKRMIVEKGEPAYWSDWRAYGCVNLMDF